MLFVGMAAVLWGIGALMRAPVAARLVMIAILYGGVLLVHLTLPAGAALPRALGGSAASWGALGVLSALGLGYGAVVRRLKARAHPAVPPPAVPGQFRPAELDRYARHIMLRELGGPGQRALRGARVLVVGAGGLGSPALLYLAAAGVGTIGVIDDDVVENSNLQRQVIHTDARIGMAKVFSAEAALRALNPFVTVRPYHRRLVPDMAEGLLADYDLILDGSDNFDTRYLVNAMAVGLGKPLISAAMTQWEGQIGLYDPTRGGPCYECLFPERPAPGLVPSCAEAGIVAPLPGIIGSMMALEAVKAITGAGEGLRGRLMIYDALYAEVRVIRAGARPGCAICGHLHAPAADQGQTQKGKG
jgi:molybdopterin/thiamine biosynthesis adenylyltransferase